MIGALLALVGLGAALRGGHTRSPWARSARARVVAAALAGFAYWAVHGSFDWFWEFAGLGAPAFALLGLACALSPREPQKPGSQHLRRLGIALGAVVALVAVASLTAPWLSQLQVQSAARIWTKSPQTAYVT